MNSKVQPPMRRGSTLRQVWDSPLYRGSTIAMVLSGFGVSAAAPQIALFLVKVLGASLPTAGLFYLTNLTAPLAGYLVGARSDRTGNRLGLFRLCAAAGFIGWIGVAWSTKVWMPFAISALVLGFSGAAASQVFAAVHDRLEREPGSDKEGVVSVIRMALTAGWVVGPVVGSSLGSWLGLRLTLLLTAVCLLAQIAPLGAIRTREGHPATASAPRGGGPSGRRRGDMLPLLLFCGLYVLVYAGEPIKYGFLPIYMTQQLRIAPEVSGAVIGIQPLVELLIMPFSLMVSRRVGLMQIMAFGAALGVAANLCFATIGSAGGMFLGQIFMGGVWGIFAALGIIAAQRLLPTAVATASALFMSSSSIGSAVGGLSGSLGVALLGLPHLYLVPGGFALLAVIGLSLMARAGYLESAPQPAIGVTDAEEGPPRSEGR